MKSKNLLLSLMLLSAFLAPNLFASDSIQVSTNVVIYGCMNPKALNYNQYATKSNGTCVFDSTLHQPDSLMNKLMYGCTDSTALNYNPYAKVDNGHCIYKRIIIGCTDSLALNFKPKATSDDGSCKYERTIWGCTDSLALNYNPNANHDNGYCKYIRVIKGCTDPTALNYNPNANQENKSCIFIKNDSIPGCTDPYALNFNPHAKKDNGKCKYTIVNDTLRGCLDSLALNYNPVATKSGKCIYTSKDTIVMGCKSHKALNFNKYATIDDGSCVFARPVNTVLTAISDNMDEIIDTLSVILNDACGFDFSIPVDTVFIAGVRSLKNNSYEVKWAIKQDTTITHVKTTFTIGKEGASLLYLSLVCNQGIRSTTSGSMKTYGLGNDTELVKALTVASVVPAKVISGTNNLVDNSTIGIYPNPVTERMFLNYSSTSNKNIVVNIYSIEGKMINTVNLNCTEGNNLYQINTSELKSGMHFMTINDNGATLKTIKFAKF